MAEYILLRRVQTPTQNNTVSAVASGTVAASGSLDAISYAPIGETGTWSEVQLGTGSLDGARRIITPAAGMYPNPTGVSFWKNGVFNRTDATGPNESSVYHFYPVIDLVGGETLRAEWVDVNGIARESTYSVPVPAPVSPTASGVISVGGSVYEPPTPGALLQLNDFPTATGTRTQTMLTSGTLTTSSNGQVIEQHRGRSSLPTTTSRSVTASSIPASTRWTSNPRPRARWSSTAQ